MELKAAEKDSVKVEPLLQQSLAEKDAALAELKAEVENMTEAFEEKGQKMESLKLQYETFTENYSKRSIKVLEALNNQRERVLTLEGENLSLKDEVCCLKSRRNRSKSCTDKRIKNLKSFTRIRASLFSRKTQRIKKIKKTRNTWYKFQQWWTQIS